jgi:hypothetical protein
MKRYTADSKIGRQLIAAQSGTVNTSPRDNGKRKRKGTWKSGQFKGRK